MPQQDVTLDEIDLRLLQTLEEHGALGNQELADFIHLSPSQCSRRRQRLEELGVIRGYRVELDARKLGVGLIVFVHVTLRTHSPENSRHFLELIEWLKEVQEAYMLTGDSDYLLKLCVPDLETLTHLMTAELLPHQSVERVRSNIVLQSLKHRSSLVRRSMGVKG